MAVASGDVREAWGSRRHILSGLTAAPCAAERLTSMCAKPRGPDPCRDRVEELPPLLTPQEAAKLLRTTARAVYLAQQRGKVPGVVRVGRRLLFRRDDLLKFAGLCPAASRVRDQC